LRLNWNNKQARADHWLSLCVLHENQLEIPKDVGVGAESTTRKGKARHRWKGRSLQLGPSFGRKAQFDVRQPVDLAEECPELGAGLSPTVLEGRHLRLEAGRTLSRNTEALTGIL
jgi:hypothetical protein